MGPRIPHGHAGHVCSGNCDVPKAPLLFTSRIPALNDSRKNAEPATPPVISLEEAAKTEYDCSHSPITSRAGLGRVIDSIDLTSDHALRPSLHNAGHFELSGAELPYGRGAVRDLHQNLIPVFENIAQKDSTLSPEQASLTAMILRLTSTDLMKKTDQAPDFKPLSEAWERIFNNSSETVVGEVVANLMAIYKQADEVNKTAGTAQSLAVNFGKVVMASVKDKIFQESESPIRKWFVQSLPSAYYPSLTDLYVLMIRHGSTLEIDVALNALDFFANNPNLGGNQRNLYADKYRASVSSLLSGNSNPNITEDFLQRVARYGREITYLEKARQITQKI